MFISDFSGEKYLYGERDVERLNLRFEGSEFFNNFKTITESEEFQNYYQRMIESYQKFLENQGQLLSFEREYLSDSKNIWNCYYVMAAVRLNDLAHEKYKQGYIDMRENMLELQNIQFYKAVLLDMLEGCKKTINTRY